MNNLPNCPDCNAKLSDWEQKERECFSCGWNEQAAQPANEFDTEIDDDTQD